MSSLLQLVQCRTVCVHAQDKKYLHYYNIKIATVSLPVVEHYQDIAYGVLIKISIPISFQTEN